jgi:ribosome recycling factor
MLNDDIEFEMMHALDTMDNRLLNIRAGRASASLVNGINVDYYGAPTPLPSLANLTIPDARTLMIKPFDKSCVKDIVKAINEANIGINPTDNGEAVILTIPALTEDRRKDYVKQAKQIAEETKVALRKVRQEANEDIKKDDSISEDDQKRMLDEVQKLIETYNKKVDEKLDIKEKELMQV